jgi:hypothetical protein
MKLERTHAPKAIARLREWLKGVSLIASSL